MLYPFDLINNAENKNKSCIRFVLQIGFPDEVDGDFYYGDYGDRDDDDEDDCDRYGDDGDGNDGDGGVVHDNDDGDIGVCP